MRRLEEVDRGILQNTFVLFKSKEGQSWQRTEQARLNPTCSDRQESELEPPWPSPSRLEQVYTGKRVNTLCFSADGHLASGGNDGSIVLFDTEGQTQRRLEKVHGGEPVNTLCFSADGRLASGVDDGRVISLEAFDVLPLAC